MARPELSTTTLITAERMLSTTTQVERMLLRYLLIAAVYVAEGPGSHTAVYATQGPGSHTAVYATQGPSSHTAVDATQGTDSDTAVYAAKGPGSHTAVYAAQSPGSPVLQYGKYKYNVTFLKEDTDTKASVTENVHDASPQSVDTVKDASTVRYTRASVTEYLQNATPQSVNTGKNATVNTDNRAPLTEYVHNTTPHSVSTDKDASKITENAALVTESLYKVTPQSVNIGKDERTNGRYPASTPDITTQESSGDYNMTKKSDDTVDNWTTSSVNVTHRQGILKELEAMFYEQMCNTSCEDKCGQRQMIGDSRCYCDRACIQVGDCCLDYEE
ncbi:hypothetical protein LSAT2_000255, partial [Lamellibrachia satsuma]